MSEPDEIEVEFTPAGVVTCVGGPLDGVSFLGCDLEPPGRYVNIGCRVKRSQWNVCSPESATNVAIYLWPAVDRNMEFVEMIR